MRHVAYADDIVIFSSSYNERRCVQVMSLHNKGALRPRRATCMKTKREGVTSRCSGALKPDRLGLSCKANICSDSGAGDLGVLTTHETSPWFPFGDDGSTRPGRMPPQVQVRTLKSRTRHNFISKYLTPYLGGRCLRHG